MNDRTYSRNTPYGTITTSKPCLRRIRERNKALVSRSWENVYLSHSNTQPRKRLPPKYCCICVCMDTLAVFWGAAIPVPGSAGRWSFRLLLAYYRRDKREKIKGGGAAALAPANALDQTQMAPAVFLMLVNAIYCQVQFVFGDCFIRINEDERVIFQTLRFNSQLVNDIMTLKRGRIACWHLSR